MEEKLEKLKQLIKNTPELTQKILSENVFLRRFLKVCGDDEHKALELLLANLKFRKTAPHVFFNRDVTSDEIQSACKGGIQFLPLPKLTRNNLKITILRFPSTDTSLYNLTDVTKMMLMSMDARTAIADAENDEICDGEIIITDVQNYTFKHFLKACTNPTTANVFTKYAQDVSQVEMKQVHILNPSWIMDKFMALMRPFVKKELLEMLKSHPQGYESLFQYIEPEVLPIEYGGTLGKFDDLFDDWMEVFKQKRDFLMDEEIWKIL